MKKEVKIHVDSRKRIHLGKVSKNLYNTYRAYEENGKIILEPYIEIPAHEEWLYQSENKPILETLKRAIKNLKDHPERTSELEGLEKFIDLNIDNDDEEIGLPKQKKRK